MTAMILGSNLTIATICAGKNPLYGNFSTQNKSEQKFYLANMNDYSFPSVKSMKTYNLKPGAYDLQFG